MGCRVDLSSCVRRLKSVVVVGTYGWVSREKVQNALAGLSDVRMTSHWGVFLPFFAIGVRFYSIEFVPKVIFKKTYDLVR